MNIIISPHPDDELIGCCSLIRKGLIEQVIYIDPPPERLAQAQVVGKELGFAVDTLNFGDLQLYLTNMVLGEEAIVWVPDSLDNHPLHRAVNSIARMSGCRLGYYSTDMTASFIRELSIKEQEEKLAMLNMYYPDQKSLWKSNWKYFLFEGIVYDALCSSPTSS